MRVTEVKVRKTAKGLNGAEGVLAFVNVVLDNELAIKEIRLMRLHGELTIAMPNREKTRDCCNCETKNPYTHKYCRVCGEELKREESDGRIFFDLVHPINGSLREHLEIEIFKEFHEAQHE